MLKLDESEGTTVESSLRMRCTVFFASVAAGVFGDGGWYVDIVCVGVAKDGVSIACMPCGARTEPARDAVADCRYPPISL